MFQIKIACLSVIILMSISFQCWGINNQPEARVSNLIEKLSSTEDRGRAAQQLVTMGPDVIAELDRVLKENSTRDLKEGIIYALREFGTPDAETVIKEALKDSDSQVRFHAAYGLFRLQFSRAAINKAELWEPICAGLQDDDSDIRSAAAWTLAIMDREKAVPFLIETLDREFKKPREKRGTYQCPKSLEFYGEDATISECAGELGVAPKTIAPVVESYLGKSIKDLDYCLAYVLMAIGHTPYHSNLLLEGATKCSSATIRINIIDKLWNVSDQKVEKILKDALNDPYKVVVPKTHETLYPIRMAAERCLKKLNAKAKGIDPLSVDKEPLPNISGLTKKSANQE